MNNLNEISGKEGGKEILDFSTVELCAGWPQREEFFNSFPGFAPLFTYHFPYEDGAAFERAKRLKLTGFQVVFNSPEEFLSAGRLEFPAPRDEKSRPAVFAGVDFGPGGGPELAAACNEFLSRAKIMYGAAAPLAVRLYVEPHTFEDAGIIVDGIYGRPTSWQWPRRLSICFGGGSAAGIIDLNRRIAAKYPFIRGSLHIEPSKGLDRVANALLFCLKFSDPLLADCTIAPVFADLDLAVIRGPHPAMSPASGHENPYFDTLEILRSLEFANIPGVFFISCPTCSRCRIDIISLAKKIYERVKYIETPIKIAVMGCEVNGPGEASHADIGVAGSPGGAVIFERGKIVERASPEDAEFKLMERVARHVR